VLWGAAGLTVLVLVLIIGYIVVNGFYQREVTDAPFLSSGEEVVSLGGGDEMAILATRSLRLPRVDYTPLAEIVRGESSFVGFLTRQNRRATVAVGGDAEFRNRVADFFLADADSLPQTSTPEQISTILSENDAGIALVPVSFVERISGARQVTLRHFTVVVNPFVTELQAGRRLNLLRRSGNHVQGLFDRSISAWEEVGGPGIEVDPANLAEGYQGVYDPLPVTPVVFGQGLEAPYVPGPSVFPVDYDALSERTVFVDSLDEFERAIAADRGAVGIVRAREALNRELTTVNVERVDHRLNLSLQTLFRPPSRAGAVGGLSYIIINTMVMVLFVVAIVTPIGVSAAIYLTSYAKQGLLLKVLRIGTDTLAGVPSIIFGLFGLVFFSQILGLQTGLLAGSFTLTLMILPTVVRTSEEAIKSVPKALSEGSLALGATKLQTIFRVVLPAASPGILTGIILGIGRAVGETAALLYTMGSNLALVRNLNSPMRVLSVHLYLLIRENISLANAFAAATILVIIVILVNYTTTRLIGRLNRVASS
jgi:phosphate transport system permease protein